MMAGYQDEASYWGVDKRAGSVSPNLLELVTCQWSCKVCSNGSVWQRLFLVNSVPMAKRKTMIPNVFRDIASVVIVFDIKCRPISQLFQKKQPKINYKPRFY